MSTEVNKDSNPKAAFGSRKGHLSVVPMAMAAYAGVTLTTHHPAVLFYFGLGMLEGACKYGSHNYRVAGSKASVYYNATMRHLADHYSGLVIDAESGLPSIIKAATSVLVVLDVHYLGLVTDDRPPRAGAGPALDKQDPASYLIRWWEHAPGEWDTLLGGLRALADAAETYLTEAGLCDSNWLDKVNTETARMLAKYPEPKAPVLYTSI